MGKDMRDTIYSEFVRYTGIGCLLYEMLGAHQDRPELLCAILAMMGLAKWESISWITSAEHMRTETIKALPSILATIRKRWRMKDIDAKLPLE